MPGIVDFEKDITNLVNLGVESAAKRIGTYNTSDYPGGLILSSEGDSHVPPHFITVKDVDTLKELCGIPDTLFTEGGLAHDREVPPPVEAVKTDITNPLHPHVCNALSTYIFGNSQTVSTWKDTLNQMRFPMQVATFTPSVINVQPGSPLQLVGTEAKPIALVCDEINVDQGGQVICQGPGKVSPNTLNSTGAGSNPTLISVGGNGGGGGNGGSTADGATGGKGADATTSGKSGCNAAGKGGTGTSPAAATDGGPGGTGGNANEINYSVTTMNGSYTVGSIGGNGGKGGNGGNGGNGGPGGPGGASCRDCGTGAQGPGGNGAAAGNGGPGGVGGNGAMVYINYTNGSPVIGVSNQSATGGDGGNPGTAGSAGAGTPPGTGGTPGTPGKGATGGLPGKVTINGNTIS